MRFRLIFLVYGCPVAPAAFVEKAILPPFHLYVLLIWRPVHICLQSGKYSGINISSNTVSPWFPPFSASLVGGYLSSMSLNSLILHSLNLFISLCYIPGWNHWYCHSTQSLFNCAQSRVYSINFFVIFVVVTLINTFYISSTFDSLLNSPLNSHLLGFLSLFLRNLPWMSFLHLFDDFKHIYLKLIFRLLYCILLGVNSSPDYCLSTHYTHLFRNFNLQAFLEKEQFISFSLPPFLSHPSLLLQLLHHPPPPSEQRPPL